ncbi:MAG: O-antigen ligase family protein [Pseudomonadota bacterium]
MIESPSKPGPNTALILLAGFACILALCGGTSNPGSPQDVILRPACALLLVPALYWWPRGASETSRAPLYFVLAWAIWTGLQLVPLPTGLWSVLPDRALVAELDQLLGVEGQWRPISWVPSRGWNALAGMVVPICALVLAMAARARSATLLNLLLGVALLDATMNFLQLVSGGQDTFYLYRPHPGQTDGLFSNENHSGVFSAVGLLVTARLALASRGNKQAGWMIGYGAAYLVFLLAVLVGGSRAALVAGLGALLASGVMFYAALEAKGGGASIARWVPASPGRRRMVMLFVPAAFFAAMVGLFIWLERSPSFDGVLTRNSFEDLRWELAPILGEMIAKNWLLGIGFGAFEEYYHIYEPTGLMLSKFINQAHNDWGQVILEGGLPAVAIALALAAWVARALMGVLRRDQDGWSLVVFWLSVIAIVAAASLIDYPVRTPIFQVALVWLLLVLGRDESGSEPTERLLASSVAGARWDKRRRRHRWR